MNLADIWSNTSTAGVGTTVNLVLGSGSGFACMRHAIQRTGARGSNGHARREQGRCVYCGKRFLRVIRWGTRDAGRWRAV